MLLSVSPAYNAQEIGCQARHQAVANQLSCANAYHNNDHIVILEQALRLELRKAQQSEKTGKVAKNNFNEADLKLWILQDELVALKIPINS
ncbi:hypothetical protein [Aeromonas salmonicida]|uniref:hypothetical protein n=1 Tax=Aeromonas salmonicida TaxID=645 RepID=UPI003D1ECC09